MLDHWDILAEGGTDGGPSPVERQYFVLEYYTNIDIQTFFHLLSVEIHTQTHTSYTAMKKLYPSFHSISNSWFGNFFGDFAKC